MQRYVLIDGHRHPISAKIIYGLVVVLLQTEIRIDASGAYYEVGQGGDSTSGGNSNAQKLQTAEISLNDCLACR